MLYNVNWDVCPQWVRSLNRTTSPENAVSPEESNRRRQKHNHEFQGSTKLAEEGDERHNHRFAGVSGEAIPTSNGNHKHKIRTTTDFAGHFHEIETFTGPAVDVGNGKHVHFAQDNTSFDDGHCHRFQFATLIENPLNLRDRC